MGSRNVIRWELQDSSWLLLSCFRADLARKGEKAKINALNRYQLAIKIGLIV